MTDKPLSDTHPVFWKKYTEQRTDDTTLDSVQKSWVQKYTVDITEHNFICELHNEQFVAREAAEAEVERLKSKLDEAQKVIAYAKENFDKIKQELIAEGERRAMERVKAAIDKQYVHENMNTFSNRNWGIILRQELGLDKKEEQP